jgi:hypothetical protein
MCWYLNLTAKCKWGNVYSEIFSVDSGVCQGGVLSLWIFAIYIDELILELHGSNLGCYIIEMFLVAIFYADDLALLAPTRSSLQGLLNICESYGIEWCISHNSLKTKVMIFGRPTYSKPLYLNESPIEFVDHMKYLGISIVAGKEFSSSFGKSSFYRSATTILNTIYKPSEHVLMKLLYANCVPILSYACEVKSFLGNEMSNMSSSLSGWLNGHPPIVLAIDLNKPRWLCGFLWVAN